MLRICELAVIPLIVLSGGLLESFFEHPILYTVVFFTTMLVCMVLATKGNNMKGSAFVIVAVLALAGLVGWAMNAYKLTQCDFVAPYKCEAIRAAGVFVPPIGAIAGYVNLND